MKSSSFCLGESLNLDENPLVKSPRNYPKEIDVLYSIQVLAAVFFKVTRPYLLWKDEFDTSKIIFTVRAIDF